MKTLTLILIILPMHLLANDDWTQGLPIKYIGGDSNSIEYVEIIGKDGKIKKKIKPGQVKERMYQFNGGFVQKTGSGEGKILVVNTQDFVPTDTFDDFFKKISICTHLNIEVVDGTLPELFPSHNAKMVPANAALYITCTNSLPQSLVAYDNGWAIVNLYNHLQFSESINERALKLAIRSFLLLCGAADTATAGNLLWPISSVKDLDEIIVREKLHPSVIQAVGLHMVRTGMKPTITTTYRKACEQGWAPAPTNEFQKAIWDKVNATPKTPMKIEFDPKKGR